MKALPPGRQSRGCRALLYFRILLCPALQEASWSRPWRGRGGAVLETLVSVVSAPEESLCPQDLSCPSWKEQKAMTPGSQFSSSQAELRAGCWVESPEFTASKFFPRLSVEPGNVGNRLH